MTLLCHVDESWDAHHLLHAGVLLDGPQAAEVEARLNSFVRELAWDELVKPGAELHGNEIFGRSGGWSKLRDQPQRAVDIFEHVLSLLERYDAEVLYRATRLGPFYKQYGPNAIPNLWEFSNLLERVDIRLRDRQSFGVVIADDNEQHRANFKLLVPQAKSYGTGGYRSSKLENIIGSVHLAESHLNRLTQLADMVAFVLRRRFSFPLESDAACEKAMAHLHSLVENRIPNPPYRYYSVR